MRVAIKQDPVTNDFLPWPVPPMVSTRADGHLAKVDGWQSVDALIESGVEVTWDSETDAHDGFVERDGDPPPLAT